jgi:hypothetical protein
MEMFDNLSTMPIVAIFYFASSFRMLQLRRPDRVLRTRRSRPNHNRWAGTAIAHGNLPKSDPHVAWLAQWRLLRDRINSSTYDMPVAVDELLNLADAIVDTPPATMAGLLAIVEVAQHDLMRQGEEDSVAARALAAIGRTLLATSASA